jgi:hypothetical protein
MFSPFGNNMHMPTSMPASLMHGQQSMNNVNLYNQQPSRNSNISIDDIIIALQNAKEKTCQLQQQIETLKSNQPKPIDLNRTNISYVVCHKVFASGKVYQPDTPLLSDEGKARYARDKLSHTNRDIEYSVHKVTWSLDSDQTFDSEQSHELHDDMHDIENMRNLNEMQNWSMRLQSKSLQEQSDSIEEEN